MTDTIKLLDAVKLWAEEECVSFHCAQINLYNLITEYLPDDTLSGDIWLAPEGMQYKRKEGTVKRKYLLNRLMDENDDGLIFYDEDYTGGQIIVTMSWLSDFFIRAGFNPPPMFLKGQSKKSDSLNTKNNSITVEKKYLIKNKGRSPGRPNNNQRDADLQLAANALAKEIMNEKGYCTSQT